MATSNIAERDISPQNQNYWKRPETSNSAYSPRPIVSPQQINIASSRNKMPNSRLDTSGMKKEIKRYY